MRRILSMIIAIMVVVSFMEVFPISANAINNEIIYENLNEYEEKYNISYHSNIPCSICANYLERHTHAVASPMKILSFEEFNSHFQNHAEITSKYSESFFNDKFLLLVHWNEGYYYPHYRITSVRDKGGLIDVELTIVPYEGFVLDARAQWTVIIEMDREVSDSGFLVTTLDGRFGEVPKTGVPDATGAIVAMATLLPISAALWCCILRRRLKSGNNGNG